jgi:hypothetical protein
MVMKQKQPIKNIISLFLFTVVIAFTLQGCYETHYYNHYHHHTRDWYDHRHQAYPAGVDFNVDVR